MTFPVPVLDHVVINVASQLDEASEIYRRLGFQLSERGHHTLGSSNHLAIFDESYLDCDLFSRHHNLSIATDNLIIGPDTATLLSVHVFYLGTD